MRHLPLALLIVAASTIVVLFLMTGSVVLPIKALLMNVLTLSATFGLLVLIFQDGRFEGLLGYTSQGALEATMPVLLFAVAFGLSTDYGVFLLSRIKEARDNGASDSESVAIGLERTGRIVTAAAVLFSIAIGAFATSEIIFIKENGVGTALAVLIDATIIRALLVPSLMELLGKWNWWAPRPLRRVHTANRHLGGARQVASPAVKPKTRSFQYEGFKLVYDEYGTGDRVVILSPGLLFSRKMHGPLAQTLASRGHRVICIDLLGHGDSDRPEEMWNYSMPIFGAQVLALMDHLELEKAVLGGTSLGANTTLEACAADQDRVQGMLIEMPVLDNALLGLRDRLHAAAAVAHVRRAGHAGGGPRAVAGAAPRAAARPDAARLGQPGPQAVGLGAAGAVLRPHGAAARGAPRARAARAGDRPPARPDPSRSPTRTCS